MLKLAIISSHPIQYYAPIFQALAGSGAITPKVFYTWSQTATQAVQDPGFGRAIRWDIPLLEGYEHEFVPNIAEDPGTHHFRGLRNPGLNDAVERWQADAILVFGWNSESHLKALRHFKGRIPVFFRGDSTLLNPSPHWKRLARRAFLTWIYRHVDVAISVGSNSREYFRWCGLADERIAFAPHAVDVARFQDAQGTHAQQAERWRRELGIGTGERTVVFAGKLMEVKDPLLLVEAFLESRSRGHLIFVGTGPLESQVRARARGHAEVHFLPFQNQAAMPGVYRLGSTFVLPSRSETWGLALNEAMACARPVIASDRVGGARDLVRPGMTGWTFESGNRIQLAEVLRSALTCQDDTLGDMSRAAREEANRWSIPAAAEGIEHAVVRFASRGRGSNAQA